MSNSGKLIFGGGGGGMAGLIWNNAMWCWRFYRYGEINYILKSGWSGIVNKYLKKNPILNYFIKANKHKHVLDVSYRIQKAYFQSYKCSVLVL